MMCSPRKEKVIPQEFNFEKLWEWFEPLVKYENDKN